MNSKEKSNFFYILVAASAVGKSALMRQLINDKLWTSIPKYSTRDVRYKDGEIDDVIELDYKQIKDMSAEDAATIRLSRIVKLKELCGDSRGVVYYKNNNFYGIRIEDILNNLPFHNVVAIISDFHVIKKLKTDERLKNKIKVMYIASTIDERELLKRFKSREAIKFDTNSDDKKKAIQNIQSLCSVLGSATRLNYMDRIEEVMPLINEEWNNILPYFETIKTRGTNIRMLYNQYIDNIMLIDYPLLNFYDLNFMFVQAKNILNNAMPERHITAPPVFMVCAAPSSGKATLMEIVGDLGEVNGNIRITHKYAKREAREKTDGRDGMIAIGENGSFDKYILLKNKIWEWEFHKNNEDSQGIKYAVDRSEIEKNIQDGVAQIFISNMFQIDTAKEYYPDNMVILYLHATHETETRNHITEKCKTDIIREIMRENDCNEDEAIQIAMKDEYRKRIDMDLAQKLEEIKDIHYSFLKYNHQIDHVLLNTGTREDLVAQMTNLINYYAGN